LIRPTPVEADASRELGRAEGSTYLVAGRAHLVSRRYAAGRRRRLCLAAVLVYLVVDVRRGLTICWAAKSQLAFHAIIRSLPRTSVQ
jgi:hypothetical protein